MRVILAMAALTIALHGPALAQGKKTDPPKADPTANEYLGKTVKEWEAQLDSKDRAKAVYAVEAILNFSPDKAALALPSMIRIHESHRPGGFSPLEVDPSLRLALTGAIGAILAKNEHSNKFPQGVERLRASLRDSQNQIRLSALHSLQMLGYAAHSATKDVVALARDMTSYEIRQAAIATLTSVAWNKQTGMEKPVFDELYNAAEKDPCYQVRLAGIDAMLQALDLRNEAAQKELENRMDALAVSDPEPLVKLAANWAAIFVKAESGKNKDKVAKKNVDQIAVLMKKSPDPAVRFKAIETGTKIGIKYESKAFVPHLIACLEDPDLNVRLGAIQALGASAKLAEDAVVILQSRIDDKEAAIQQASIAALGRMGRTALPAVPDIIKKLASPDVEVQGAAIISLGNIGEVAVAAVVPLIGKLSDPNLNIRAVAMAALAKIGDKRAIEPLLKITADPTTSVRIMAIQALGLMGKNGGDAVEPLCKFLGDKDLSVLGTAIQALVQIGSKDAVDPLARLLDDPRKEVRTTAIHALGALKHCIAVKPLARHISGTERNEHLSIIQALGNTRCKEAVAPLIEQLADKSAKVVEVTLVALATIGPDAKESVPAVIKLLTHAEPKIVYYAIGVLSKIGPAAKDAVPHLQKVAANEKQLEVIRNAAIYTIGVILESGKQKTPGK